MNSRTLKFEDKVIRITTPPIHQHYNPATDRAELCGRVVCPHGFIGIEVVENPKLLETSKLER